MILKAKHCVKYFEAYHGGILTDDVQLKCHGHFGLCVDLTFVDSSILGLRGFHMQSPLPRILRFSYLPGNNFSFNLQSFFRFQFFNSCPSVSVE